LLFQTPASPVPKSPTTSIHLLCTSRGGSVELSANTPTLHRSPHNLSKAGLQQRTAAEISRNSTESLNYRQVAVAQTAAIDLTPPQLPFLPPAESQKASLAVASLYHSKIAIACAKTTSLAERHYGALPSEKAEPACSTWGLSGV
jgi:hypothetical protein